MELTGGGVAALEQLDEAPGGQGAEVLAGEQADGLVHALAPAPETVLGAGAAPGQAGDQALVDMRVDVDHARKHRAGQALGSLAVARMDAGDASVPVELQGHVLAPAVVEQGVSAVQALRHAGRHRESLPTSASSRSIRGRAACGSKSFGRDSFM